MRLGLWLEESRVILKQAGITNYHQELLWFCQEALQVKSALGDRELQVTELKLLNEWVNNRVQGYPFQYLIGKASFMGMDFFVDQSVLIPRPETELLVEKILTMACLNAKVLDIGTGSGCIPISLLKNRPDLSVLASDISPKSLETAWRNKKSILPLACPLEFICSNLFEDIPLQQFNIIVSNPPYLSLQDYAVIASELSYEPPEALTDHGDGLSFYRQIAEKASQYLCHKGLVFLEIGFSQEKAVCEIFQSYLCKDKVKDSNGFIRVLVFEKDF